MSNTLDPAVKRNIRITVALALTFALITIGALVNKLSHPRILSSYETRDYGAYLLEPPRALNPIALIDHNGQPFTEDYFKGQWTIVFFGFSHCADVCPTTMATLAKTYQELKAKDKADLNVVLITVDPKRDTPEVLEKYVHGYNPDFLGVTGDINRIRQLSLQLNTGFEMPEDGGENYQVQHSGNLLLMNPEGELHSFIRPPFEHGGLRVLWRSIRASY